MAYVVAIVKGTRRMLVLPKNINGEATPMKRDDLKDMPIEQKVEELFEYNDELSRLRGDDMRIRDNQWRAIRKLEGWIVVLVLAVLALGMVAFLK